MRRVLVVLPNWYGETLFATPFLAALRRQAPAAEITALGRPACGDILQHSAAVQRFIPFDERGVHRSLVGRWRLARILRRERFETAFLLRKSLSRALLLAAAGIPRRVGFDAPKTRLVLTVRAARPAGRVHKAWSYFSLLEAVGLQGDPAPYVYAVSEEERAAARQLLAGAGASDRPMAIMHPGANWPHKRWPAEGFAELADRLSATRRIQIVVTGGPEDRLLAAQVAERMRQPAVMLAGRTTLRQLAACLEQAQLVVAADTGVLHVAAALRRPVVGLYGPTDPALTGPLGASSRTVVIHHPSCCPAVPCYQPDTPSHPGMRAITVDEVYEAACRLLEQADG